MSNIKTAVIIPARLASTRLPNKPLVNILGKTMIARVYEKAQQVENVEVYVACDSQEVKNEIENIGGQAIITDPDLPSGTDRIYAAMKQIGKDFEYIVNLQGDLPNVDPSIIEAAIAAISETDADIATVATIIEEEHEIDDPNIVKIAIALQKPDTGKALYFSRCPIPYSKNKNHNYYHHIGIYVYKKEALEKFVQLQPSKLEHQESLEQLRALENDMQIAVKIVQGNPLSVDTAKDLENVIKSMS